MKKGILFFVASLAFAGPSFGGVDMPYENGLNCSARMNGQLYEIKFNIPQGKVLRSVRVYQWDEVSCTWVDLSRYFQLHERFSKDNGIVLHYDQGGVNTIFPNWGQTFCVVPVYY